VRIVSPEAATEIYEIRAAMEALACRRAAARATRQHVDGLSTLVQDMEAAVGRDDVARFNHVNITFHERLVELSASRELAVAYRRLLGNLTLFRLRTLAVEGALAESNAEHRRIVECLAAGDGAGAATVIQEHIEASSRRTQQALQAGQQGGGKP
jgi:DNA-binding GntR family transcriptional regulator